MAEPSEGPELPPLEWIPPDQNPWRIPLLDVRPVTQGMVSTSQDPQMAANAVSYQGDDGTGFLEQEPSVARSIPSTLVYRRDRLLADGALFIPSCMEHKWALYHHDGEILVIRSWQRRVHVAAQVEQEGKEVRIEAIHGSFSDEEEPASRTERIFDFLIRSHALGLIHPAPISEAAELIPSQVALFCFSMFGNMAHVASVEEPPRTVPEPPLRSISLLHMAVARADAGGVEVQLSRGVPINLLGRDGLPPFHWALGCEKTDMLEFLLSKGCDVDVRSAEGATTLMTASQGARAGHLSWLLAHDANPNARDARGFTALHRAAEMGHRELVEILLAGGADPRAEAHGHTPLSLAEKRGHPDIASRLGRA
jgi:hypothetical protein